MDNKAAQHISSVARGSISAGTGVRAASKDSLELDGDMFMPENGLGDCTLDLELPQDSTVADSHNKVLAEIRQKRKSSICEPLEKRMSDEDTEEEEQDREDECRPSMQQRRVQEDLMTELKLRPT